MEQEASQTYSHTADYQYIDFALKARWAPFCALERELHEFEPKAIEDFGEYRSRELARLRALNPNSTDESLLEFIDGQIRSYAQPNVQIHLRFDERVMSEYVTVAFLAHALSEAAINAILAVGLVASGATELFALLERADIKEKWVAGPKSFHPAYSKRKGSALYQTLHHLTKQRNAFVHYKIELEMGGEKKLEGSRLDRAPIENQIKWIRRFFSLPYDLAAHARTVGPQNLPFLLRDAGPIHRIAAHAEA